MPLNEIGRLVNGIRCVVKRDFGVLVNAIRSVAKGFSVLVKGGLDI